MNKYRNEIRMKVKIKRRRALKILGISLFVLLTLIGALIVKIYSDINELKKSVVVETVNVETIREKEVEIDKGEPLNVLIIGTDSNNLERTTENGYVSRSDAIMIVSLNPELKTTKILSIPRDALTLIEGQDGPDKINHAYAYGGIELSIDTIQKYLNIPIDYYAVLDMSGLEQLIDAVGGIEVTSPLTFEYRGTQFKAGETREVNGVKAMNFARMRYDDPEGEVGRQNRQKLVIKAILDKLLSLNAINYYPAILQVVAKNVRTNFDLTSILSVYPKYISALDNVRALQFDTIQDLYLDGVFYFNIPVASRVKISNELRTHTNLPMITVSTLIDPLENSETQFTKTRGIVLNQYPSGLTQAQLDEINAAQQIVEEARSSEYYYVQPQPYYVPNVSQNSNVEVTNNGEVSSVPVEPLPSESEVPVVTVSEVPIVSEAPVEPPVIEQPIIESSQ